MYTSVAIKMSMSMSMPYTFIPDLPVAVYFHMQYAVETPNNMCHHLLR